MYPPPILDDWTNEEVAMVAATLGEKWPDGVVVDNIAAYLYEQEFKHPRPARPLAELMEEWKRLNRPLPKGWKNARK